MNGALKGLGAALASALLLGAFLWLNVRPRVPMMPDSVLPDLAGKTVRLADHRGKVVVLNVWATWCLPCVQEMPTLEALHRKMSSRDVVVLAVSQDEIPHSVKPWIQKNGLTLPVLLDPGGEVGRALGVTGYPETFIFDRQLRLVHRHVGYRDWASADLLAALERLLASGELDLREGAEI